VGAKVHIFWDEKAFSYKILAENVTFWMIFANKFGCSNKLYYFCSL